MRHTIQTKLLSLLLVLSILVSCCPAVYASEALPEDPQETVETVEETEAPEEETTEPSEAETEATEEATEPTEAAEETTTPTEEATEEATEPTEESTAPTEETTEPTEGTTEPTEEPVVLPYGFLGLPTEFVLSEEAIEEKSLLAEDEGVLELKKYEAGEDYEADTLIIHAETEEEAELFAQAYNGELLDYDYGTGLIRIGTATVEEAITAAQDMTLPLPAAYPNYIIRLDPNEDTYVEEESGFSMLEDAPQRLTWDAWVNEILTNPDPALLMPAKKSGGYSYWNNEYQYMHDVVDTYGAWGATCGSGVTVAVIDSGVKANHADLAGKVQEYDIGKGTGDGTGHGTHVAGIIAATMNNGKGGAGIAPEADIISIRVFDSKGSTSDYYLAKGIQKAVDEGADVINLSLGGVGYQSVFKAAVDRALNAGICVVAAMGNEGMNRINYPAAFDGVIGVVASDANNTRAQYSTYGSWADIAAPGTGIYSTTYDGSFGQKSGTSMATPVVSGVVALYKSVHPEATPKQIEAKMKATATKGGKDLGVGIINAAKMLSDKPQKPDILVAVPNKEGFLSMEYGTLGSTVPCESKLHFNTADWDESYYVLYTLDGKTPAVKNGTVVVGQVYDWEGIDLSPYAGKTVNVKAVQISGLGVMGTVVSKKLTVEKTLNIESLRISGPAVVNSGKKGSFTAVVEPADKASQEVAWSIVGSGVAGVKIDAKKGVLTTGKTSSGTLTIQAVSMADPSVKARYTVTVAPHYPIVKLVLNAKAQILYVGEGLKLKVSSAEDSQKNSINPDILDYKWTSSNKKVATVDEQGNVIAVGKGKATITCQVLEDGGKTASCTVTVKQQVESLEITGQTGIVPGASATYKVTASPSGASDKSVIWSLEGAPTGVTIDAKGKVKVAGNVGYVERFKVVAKSKDGWVREEFQVETCFKTESVNIEFLEVPNAISWLKWNAKGDITEIGMFTVDLKNTSSPNSRYGPENRMELYAMPKPFASGSDFLWTSSNPAVASVDEDGTVTAHKAGTTKITVTAQDGSKKKASLTVKVFVPVSSMSLTSSADKGTLGMDLMAIGKSYSHTVSFGNLYGTPTNKKILWDWQASYTKNGALYDATDELEGLVQCAKGKLTVKKNAEKVLKRHGNLQVTIFAEALDGSDVVASRTYNMVQPTTFMKFENAISSDSNGYFIWFYSDQAYYTSSGNSDFVVTSSKPQVINPLDVVYYGYSGYYRCNAYKIYIDGGVRGSSKITAKTTDGTNKSTSITLTFG